MTFASKITRKVLNRVRMIGFLPPGSLGLPLTEHLRRCGLQRAEVVAAPVL